MSEMVQIEREALSQLRALAAVNQVLVSRLMTEADGDVSGPHLAEPEVWARLDELMEHSQ